MNQRSDALSKKYSRLESLPLGQPQTRQTAETQAHPYDYRMARDAHYNAAQFASTPEARQVHFARAAELEVAYLKRFGE